MKNRLLTLEDRKTLEELIGSGMRPVNIAKKMGIHETTFYREMKRCKDYYNAEEAQETVAKRRCCIDFDILGKRFGLLTVMEYANIYNNRSWWKCVCDCGKECVMCRKILTEYCSDKRPLSCGCIGKQSRGPLKPLEMSEAWLTKWQDMIRFREIKGKCWIWTGYRQKGKCPKTSFRSKSMSVRKCMYMLINGLEHLHERVYSSCGDLFCFNPDHITLDPPLKRHFYEDSLN